jgi:hypothetical protein
LKVRSGEDHQTTFDASGYGYAYVGSSIKRLRVNSINQY